MVLLASILVMFRQDDSKLKYQGRSIAYWFDQLPATVFATTPSGISPYTLQGIYEINFNDDDVMQSFDAFSDFGNAAEPYLISKLGAEDTYLRTKLINAIGMMGIRPKRLLFRSAHANRLRATTALLKQKSLSDEAVVQISTLTNNPVNEISWISQRILERFEDNEETPNHN